MIGAGRYTSGRIALANLSAQIEALELHCSQDVAAFEDFANLSNLLFLRGDLLGRIVDHDRAEVAAHDAIDTAPDAASAAFLRARLAERFHRFVDADAFLDQALVAGHPVQEINNVRASLLQATGRYGAAMILRGRLAQDNPGIHTIGALATLLAETDPWTVAEELYQEALAADEGTSPIPCGQLLFEWGVSAMRRGVLDRAETILAELDTVLPGHVPGQGHRAEAALARGELELAEALVLPLLETSDDPEYRATYAEILAAHGSPAARLEAERAAAAYEHLLVHRLEAYADHAAAFFTGIGDRPQRAVELASVNWKLRDTTRSRKLLANAQQKAQAHLAEAQSVA